MSARKIDDVAGEPQIQPQPDGYRRYGVSVLMLMFVLSFLDRQIVNILAEPIKQDLRLADWQIGLLTGLAFAFLYTFIGIPIARRAEHANRRSIIGVSVLVWSAFTLVCGVVASFPQLLLARVGVGIGEAGLTPAAMSLIVDYSPREKRASTLAFYHMGVPLGSLCGLALGGVVADAFGWRAAFLIAGMPGLALALIALATLREPRARPRVNKAAARPHGTLGQALRMLASKPTYVLIVLATTLQAFAAYGQGPFIASFFLRVHGPELKSLAAPFGLNPLGFLGVALGLATGISGAIGVWVGGQLADRAMLRDVRMLPVIPAVATVLSIPFLVWALLAPNTMTALLVLIVPMFLNSLWYGPVHTTQQSCVPPHMRATATAVMLFVLNLMGLGLGPLTIGLLSDFYARTLGTGSGEGVRMALLTSALIPLLTAALFLLARRHIADDFER